ncbi:MAG: UDP-N-acetylmuramate--L-alanine ligase [Gemmatimonadota bacterium]|jgi:UDP-N-acetylmuramate--alanine ligase
MAAPATVVDLRDLAARGAVHFVGIAGAGMSALAELVLRSGGRVTGCDTNPGVAGAALRTLGAVIETGHDPAHVQDAVAVVTTSAVPADHPELAAARTRGIPVLKRAQALGGIVNHGTLVAIAGTHGKTTTTAMTTSILVEAGLDPTAFVGGTVEAWGSGLRPGAESLFVVEADEYDRSFFALHPTVAVITSVEPDHLDVYGTAAAVQDAFAEFVSLVPGDGRVIGCADDPGAALILRRHIGNTLGYGTTDAADLRAVDLTFDGRSTSFTICEFGEELGRIRLGVPGMHNVRNALGAIAAARFAGARLDAAGRALESFHGVARRLQELGSAAGVIVIDDYAHHPTEIEASLAAVRAVHAGARVVAVFQPHLFTRTRDFAAAFGTALANADEVWLTDVYPAREAPIPGIDGEVVVRATRDAGASVVHYVPAVADLAAALASTVTPGSVCVLMGAGDIDRAARELLERLAERSAS